jgi:CHAT domain-containing protein
MSARCVLVFVLMTCCAAVRLAQAQDPSAGSLREADERITTVDERRRAITTLLAQADELQKSGRTIEAARTLNRVGRFQIRVFLRSEALATFQQALKLLEQTPDVETRIESLNGVGDTYRKLSDCVHAQVALNEAITLSKQIGSQAGEAEALLTLSDCQNYRDHALALQSAQAALELWRSLNNKRGAAEAHIAIGYYEMVQNNLMESEQNFNAALDIWRALGVASEQAEILINLGFIEYRKGAWQDSLNFLTQAQALTNAEAEPYQMGQITAGLAEAFLETGLPEIGLVKFREALAIYRQTKTPKAVFAATWGIGRAQFLSGDYSGALLSLQTARAQAEAIGEVMLTAMCDDFLGRTQDALHDPSAALKHYQAALAGFKKAKNPMETARTLVLIGGINQRQGKIDEAREKYQNALGSFRALSDRVNESATLYALGALELSQNRLDQAEGYLKKSIDATENMRRVSSTRDLTAAISASMHDRYESYVECLMREHRAHPDRALDVRAFETSELARARSLAELLRATQTDLIAGVEPDLGKRETALRQSLRVKEDARVSLLGTKYEKKDLSALDRELAQLEEQYKQVTELIRAKYPAYEQLTAPGPLNLRQIQTEAIVDDQTLLLEFELGVERSYVWAVTRGEFSSYDLPARAEIERASHRVYELLTANQPKVGETLEQHQARLKDAELQLPSAIGELSRLLLTPVADKLGNKRLLIVADGVLQYIPFSALTVPQKSDSTSGPASFDQDRPLALDHEVVNEPSASILALLLNQSAKRTRAQKSVAVLADPVFEKDDPRITSPEPRPTAGKVVAQELELSRAFGDADQLSPAARIPRLLGSREEAGAIMNIVPWRTGFEAVDFAASRATVIGSQLDQFSIVHFATHAVLNENHPESSGIVLSLVNQAGGSEEGFLRIDDIYNLKLPVNLVVLSACNSALGKDVRGEGLIGLTRGFMYAGASSVTASLWKVDDEATAELMKRFYVGMFQKQLAPAAALREAQIGMWQTKRWHAPYYWAAFVIQGEYNQSVAVPRNFPWSMLLAAVAILSLATFSTLMILRKRRRRIASGTMGR